MTITSELTDGAIAQILGARIERYRIEARLTQAELAEQAGVGKRTLERIEAGRGAELGTLIRILRALNALDGFERLLPELPASPIERLDLRGKRRQRVAHPRGRREATERAHPIREGGSRKPWTWDVPPAHDPLPAKGGRSTKRKS